ncbi:aldehyde dehydrogenase family protein [Nocardiopsis sp. JB363]|uniref:aldehyde dehydrogenase family protein n=1 Tax=Nocardiopsis sp. JB363 TaxID=1434837 RepID=UPI00097A3275|nr:aldehyde dehydrogenase family protein [Nocardiopsis sp. JB363]SIO88828.1 Aldehyde dehydrogenase [Nocardiopsis sp. JB363]
MSGTLYLDALGPSGPYRPTRRSAVEDVTGTRVAELALVSELFAHRAVNALRAAVPLPSDERIAALERAGKAFASAPVGGVPTREYERLVARVSGTPLPAVRATTRSIANAALEAHRAAHAARPQGAVDDWRSPSARAGGALWSRRGGVLAVHAPGNHPGVHAQWLEALALGYRVAVRPSRREPFTPRRLVQALRTAGFPQDHVALLPCEHGVADTLIRDTDLAMVYGGDDVVDRHRADPRVLAQGPGRSKILITKDHSAATVLDTVVDSVLHQGGTACVNATSVFVEGDPRPLARMIADRLRGLPVLPPDAEDAVLPVRPVATARALAGHLADRAADAVSHGEDVVADIGDGSACLRPAVHSLDGADAPQHRTELPFPCVWVAPWSCSDGMAPLRDTLALTAVTDDERLIDRLMSEPTVRNVYVGAHPTHWTVPGVPHDGYLGEFLMRSKGLRRA